MQTTWRELITRAFELPEDQWSRGTGESWDDVISCTLSDADLDVEFDSGYGCKEGEPFTLWTERFVYFPVCYDGAESVGFASRRPDGKATEHWGGG